MEGYQPKDKIDTSKPPTGGSGVINKTNESCFTIDQLLLIYHAVCNFIYNNENVNNDYSGLKNKIRDMIKNYEKL